MLNIFTFSVYFQAVYLITYYNLHKMTTPKSRLIRRLKIIEGQVRGLQDMVDKDTYCIDVITQTSAVRKALSSVEDAILEGHLSKHVVHQIKHGQQHKAIKEILSVYKVSHKK